MNTKGFDVKKIFESGAGPNRQRLVLLILGMIMGCLTVDGAAQSGSFPAGMTAGSGPNFWVAPNGSGGIMTSTSGPIFTVRQYGALYGGTSTTSGPTAALALVTDNPTGAPNFLLSGTAAGVQTFSLRADGRGYFAGYVGIGTTGPASLLHVADTVGISASTTNNTAYGSANTIVQSAYGGRTQGMGAALSFAFPANTDGTNIWEQARIVGTPDNGSTYNAQGRLYLQTRYSSPSSGWAWNNNIMLTSDGTSTFGGNVKLTAGSGSSMTYQDGTVQTTAWNGVLQGGDYAESVDVTGSRAEYEPGDVLVVDPNAEGRFAKSSEPYSTAVMGIYSTRPGVVGRRQKSERSHMAEEVPMTMIGVVPTKVTDEGGPIKPGDLLVTSSKPGYAMKDTDRSQMMGAIIDKAFGHLDKGTGLIEVAVSLQ